MKLYVVMVGLPARGKSTLAKRIKTGLEEQGIRVGIFNTGQLRRQFYGAESAYPEFFNPQNLHCKQLRAQLSLQNMEQARSWLQGGGEVAIIDATNGTKEQREMIVTMLSDRPVLFIECVNDDPVLLEASIRRKTKLSEFRGIPEDVALECFKKRLHYYESMYTPLRDERCWIRVDAVDNRIQDEAPDNVLPYYAAIRDIVTSRWVQNLYVVRHGETSYNKEGRIGGDAQLTTKGMEQAEKLALYFGDMDLPYVFTSIKRRSIMTAKPLLETRPDTVFREMEEFDEIHAGDCEGMRYEDIRTSKPLEYQARARNKYKYVYPNGESYAMLKERVAQGLRRALFIAGEGTLVIIGHQAVNRVLLSLFLFQRPNDVPYTYIPQNQLYHITITQRKKLFEMVRYA